MVRTDLIAQYVEDDVRRFGPAQARPRTSGVEVWVLVAQLPAMDHDVARLAVAYGLPIAAVQAAMAYYRRHKELIDAQIALNAA
ncbi:MAG TPA: hypothetical protein VIU62_12825 [Chloroflexota bacterium]|jgi:uncharacterized protein (DUF433 family)